jgi:hypothetical protein
MTKETDGKRAWAAYGLLLVTAVGIAFLARGLYPADLPKSQDPDFIDNVFDNRAVLLAARLLLVSAAGVLAFGGLFVVVSTGNRMKNGEWLRRAGPFEISEGKLAEAEGETDFWHRAALANEREVITLRKRLERIDDLVAILQYPQ